MRIPTAIVAALILLPAIVRAIEPQRSEIASTRPNILYIVSDDHGWGDSPSNWGKTEVRLTTLDALVAQLKHTDFALFDLSKDVAEEKDLRIKLPEVYISLKKELVGHLSNINTLYPSGGSSQAVNSDKPKVKKQFPRQRQNAGRRISFSRIATGTATERSCWKNSSATPRIATSPP